ncbi:MAG: TraB/GumN family protein [Crocinitomicaceae bacterium]
MKLIAVFLICIPILTFAQESQNSLLWKITNSSTKKTSYLYGTMHISGRLAFHLGEEFFESIAEVDAIALESNPIIWLDEIFDSEYASDYLGRFGFQYQTYKGFYQEAFKLSKPENKKLNRYIQEDHYLSNWMLYRENKSQSDFEEETFLDLFIYQSGKKNNKEVYSLENFSQTTQLSKMGNLPDADKKETDAWFDKMTEKKDARELIEDAYRNKNVFLLDSIHSQVNSDNFLKHMLDIRNEIMANRIDSFIQKENISLFVGIGAAHLGGDYGVIQYLKNKGYSVEPMKTTITDKAKLIKEAFDIKTTRINFDNEYKSDLFSVKVPGKIYETPSNDNNQRQFFSPELTNGSYFSIKQISTYNFLLGLSATDYQAKIDSLLYESIPGNIISKKEITNNGFKGLDILNQTANGNYQRYYFIYTPIHIFIFKMGGKKDFVREQSDGFFNSISVQNKIDQTWKPVTAFKGDFTVTVPSFFHIKNNDKITSLYNHPELEAYDFKSKAYFLVKRSCLHDFNFIESDTYEMRRLIYKFFDDLDIDSTTISFNFSEKYPSATTSTKNSEGKPLHLKIIIKGAYYYLLTCVNTDNEGKTKFFNSFRFGAFDYTFPFKNKTDSTLLFSVRSNYLYPTEYTDAYKKAYRIKKKNDQKEDVDESYKSHSESRVYHSENFERIIVETYKYHDYSEYKSIDSLWKNEREYYQDVKKLVIRDFETSSKNGVHTLDISLTDTNSSRLILAKYIIKHSLMYSVKTNIDTISSQSEFISNFFETFTPLDTIIGQSIFDDKSKLFFKNIYSEDSITKAQALESVLSHVNFVDDDFELMKKVINYYPFSEKQIDIKKQMITDLGRLEKQNISLYLEALYTQSEDTAMYQIAILKALTNQNTKKSVDLFLKLLEQDIPLASNGYEVYNIFNPFFDSLEIGTYLFPDILDYTFVKQYKRPIYALLSELVMSGNIKAKHYKKNYKQLLREAKIELKSQISVEQNYVSSDKTSSYRYESFKNKGNEDLSNYAVMLLPFYHKTDVKLFFDKLNRVKDYKLQTDIAVSKAKYGIAVSDSIWSYLATDLINRSYLYVALHDSKLTDLYPKAFLEQSLISESQLYGPDFDIEKDSLQFIEKRKVSIQNNTGYVYFYKSKKEEDDDWYLDFIGLQPLDSSILNIKPQFEETRIKIEKYKTISEIIDDQIETIKLEGHPRAKKKETNGYDRYY